MLFQSFPTFYSLEVDVAECSCCNPTTGVEIIVARFRYIWGESKPACVLAAPLVIPPADPGLWGANVCTWDDSIVTCLASPI